MDKRATHSLTDTADAHSAVTEEVPARAERSAVTGVGAGVNDEVDLSRVLRAIAARIDVVLDERVAAGAEPGDRHRAARAWSSVVGKRATDATSDLRRHALATTVLRMSADGRVEIDDRKPGAIDTVSDGGAEGGAEGVAEDGSEDPGEAHVESQETCDRPSDADRSDALPVKMATLPAAEVATTEPDDVVSAPTSTAEPAPPAVTERADVEDRLRAVRERLATRRAAATASRVDAPVRRGVRIRPTAWRATEVRSLVQRLLIGLAIVGVSAVVSILVT